ncbi:MAG: bifunctional oligoribonuclease/PAP phosphatase NrnA [Oscillospiraceae bacterium]|nr:bifunctional oligoribonuclease/PAP phosphatase NrnA [Oscillospiraceae bacterium]
MSNLIDIPAVAGFLKNCEDAYILIHINPDGDCIGSGYSLQAVLKLLGKRSKVICADPIPERFHFLLPEEPEEDFPAKYIISVDCADETRFGELEETYAGKVQLCVDHHISNRYYAENLYVEPDASSACEVLYKIYRELGVKFTPQIAKCLYTGMATDTGCFKFSCTGADTHLFVSELMREFPEIRYDLINRAMFDVKSPSRIRAEMIMLSQMEYHLDGKCTLIWETKAICEENHINPKDTEGLTSLPLQPDGVEVGITLREQDDDWYRISLRSTDRVNVSEICERFGGGGHVRAAGCKLQGKPEQIREILLNAVAEALAS